jgi:hypothetical protein
MEQEMTTSGGQGYCDLPNQSVFHSRLTVCDPRGFPFIKEIIGRNDGLGTEQNRLVTGETQSAPEQVS